MSYFQPQAVNIKKLPILNTIDKKKHFSAGDILSITYSIKGLNYFFEGICISLRKKGIQHPETSFTLRNVLLTTGVEVTFSYYYNIGFALRVNYFKRKKAIYKRSKL
jgi:ribosomal protein L19